MFVERFICFCGQNLRGPGFLRLVDVNSLLITGMIVSTSIQLQHFLSHLRFREPASSPLSVQFPFSRSVVSYSLRPHESQHARPPCPSPTPGVHSNSTSIELVMPSSHLIFCRPLLLLPPIPPSIRVFSNESALRMRWPKYWSFSFNISPSKEHPGLISFRMDWLDLLAVQGTLKSFLQHHSSKASILWC